MTPQDIKELRLKLKEQAAESKKNPELARKRLQEIGILNSAGKLSKDYK